MVEIGTQHCIAPYSLNNGVGAAGSTAAQFALAWASSVSGIPAVVTVSVSVTGGIVTGGMVSVETLVETLMEMLVETLMDVVVVVNQAVDATAVRHDAGQAG